MLIKQVSVFMENKPGKIGAITKVLNEHKIDIRALCVTRSVQPKRFVQQALQRS